MSALIAVRKRDVIDVLTDAASTGVTTGTLLHISPKQILTAVPGCTLAGMGLMQILTDLPEPMLASGMGWRPICRGFATMAYQRCCDFDSLITIADELWEEAQKTLPADGSLPADDYAILMAGWSARRNGLEMNVIHSRIDSGRCLDYEGTLAMGPSDDGMIDAFVDKFADNPDAFDAERDGVALMEELRRYTDEESPHPRVGGYVQHVQVKRDGTTSRIIHAWPDDVGQPIDLEAAARRAEAIAEMEKLSLMELAQRIDASRQHSSEPQLAYE